MEVADGAIVLTVIFITPMRTPEGGLTESRKVATYVFEEKYDFSIDVLWSE